MLDPNPDIPEFPVKLNPKLSDPGAPTRIGFSSVHISDQFISSRGPDIEYKKKKRLYYLFLSYSYGSIFGPYEAKSYKVIIYIH